MSTGFAAGLAGPGAPDSGGIGPSATLGGIGDAVGTVSATTAALAAAAPGPPGRTVAVTAAGIRPRNSPRRLPRTQMAIASGMRDVGGRLHVAVDLGQLDRNVVQPTDHLQLPVLRFAIVVEVRLAVEEHQRLARRLGDRQVSTLATPAFAATTALLAAPPRFACALSRGSASGALGFRTVAIGFRVCRRVDFEDHRGQRGLVGAAPDTRLGRLVRCHGDRRLAVAPLDLFLGAVQAVGGDDLDLDVVLALEPRQILAPTVLHRFRELRVHFDPGLEEPSGRRPSFDTPHEVQTHRFDGRNTPGSLASRAGALRPRPE